MVTDAVAVAISDDQRKPHSDNVAIGIDICIRVGECVRFGQGVSVHFHQAITVRIAEAQCVGEAEWHGDSET